jgi:hypothetical protein
MILLDELLNVGREGGGVEKIHESCRLVGSSVLLESVGQSNTSELY